MLKRLYCTDLDNTIICSEKPSVYGICVAIKNGKNTSFMTNQSYDKFIDIIGRIDTVPVTTRCEKSYNNIYLKKYFKRALVDNGAVLISNNTYESLDWLMETRQIVNVNDVDKRFMQVRHLIESYGYIEKWGSEFVLDYVYAGESDLEKVKQELKEGLEQYSDLLLINFGKTSLLCTYKCLSKGVNIKRFADKFGYNIYLTSGDNKEDETMFSYSEISIGRANATFSINTSGHSKLDFCNWVINTVDDIV
jgi:hydroxymethylpyrimidine pyrophosphatase-like HAD family hydrolase